jgi:scyllo-inositol 2-dehydrogenase (NAD+)
MCHFSGNHFHLHHAGVFMSDQPIGVGIVGLGKWAEVIGPGIREAEGIEITACYTRTPGNREDFARRYNCEAVESYEDLLAHPRVDAVAILSSTTVHGNQAFAAIDAGKHLFMEKPITPTIAEGIEIVKKVEESGLIMQMGYETRCMAGIRHIKRLLDEGRLGQPVSCEVNWSHDLGMRLTPDDWNYHQANCPGGPLMQLGIHHVFNSMLLLGPIERVKAIGATRLIAAEVPDLTGAILEHESGAVTYLGCYYFCPRRFHLNLLGTEGSAMLKLRLPQGEVKDYLSKLLDADSITDLEIHWKGGGAPEKIDLAHGNMIVEEIKEFAEWVRGGPASPAGPRSGVETLAVILAAVESMETGRAVEMKDYLAAHGA